MAEQATPTPASATPTILVVGDAKGEVARARRVLERQCFRVVTAPTVQSALALLGQEYLVAIVADEQFEGAHGLDFLRRAMGVDERPRRVVIGLPDAALLAAAINQGWLFACLPRPFDSRALTQTASRAVEAYTRKEEQRRLLDELQARVHELETEIRSQSPHSGSFPSTANRSGAFATPVQGFAPVRVPEPNSPASLIPESDADEPTEYRLLAEDTYESMRALPAARFLDQPPKPFQSVMAEPPQEKTEIDLRRVEPVAPTPISLSVADTCMGLALRRIESGLSSGAHPEETAWGMVALLLLSAEGAAQAAIRRAASRLVGLAGSGRGGSIAAWALIERFARSQSPADQELAEASLAWVSLPAMTTPDVAAASSLLALTAAAEAGLTPEAGAAERLRAIIARLSPDPVMRGQLTLFSACLGALSGRQTSEVVPILSSWQRRAGALSGEVNDPDHPPLVSTSMAAIIFGAARVQGVAVNALRGGGALVEAPRSSL
jgi:ActR/RegA family two-component response regulator